ncbi:hypothetical protein CQA4T8M7_24960 [Sphaerotilus natans]|nr:hypothetical protein CQA4T8M7_24960 [Sphaerotilus natans]
MIYNEYQFAAAFAVASLLAGLVALLGPSGSGKTTLLRMIAGLEVPDSGQVLFQGEDATDASVRERQVGFVFQHYALFPQMTIFENVAFGLRVRPKATPVDVELSREAWNGLRERLGLRPGSTVHLKPRRITRFDASGTSVADDPAAAI